jgi:hypothetical protein
VIVVVEGPSASGKTTWSVTHAALSLVSETPSATPPPDPEAAARFWADEGSSRWARALDVERETGLAVCDTDPLKLHYSWSLWRIGEGSELEFRRQAAAYREAMANGRIGFADCFLVGVPDAETLEARRAQDATRRRRNFALHSRLGPPLREWYATIERLRPGSVRWELPGDGVASLTGEPGDRYDVEHFDALIAAVGGRAL